jgi:hypothetical protein
MYTSKQNTKTDRTETKESKINKQNALKLVLSDPYVYGNHLFMVRERLLEKEKSKIALKHLCDRLLMNGPSSISTNQLNRILFSKTALLYFHSRYWKTYPKNRNPYWN